MHDAIHQPKLPIRTEQDYEFFEKELDRQLKALKKKAKSSANLQVHAHEIARAYNFGVKLDPQQIRLMVGCTLIVPLVLAIDEFRTRGEDDADKPADEPG
jgi:hypothetical protein